MDSVLLSIVYEYYLCCVDSSTPFYPHLLQYKLNYASYLADYGKTTEARSLYDSITGIVKAAPKSVPGPMFLSKIDSLGHRLNVMPEETGSGWFGGKLARPNFDKVLGHLDKSLSKFVAGEDKPSSQDSTPQEGGIFKKLAETPNASSLDLKSKYSGFGSDMDLQSGIMPSRTHSTIGFHIEPGTSSMMHNQKGSFSSISSIPLSPPNPGFAHDALRPRSAGANRSRRSSVNKGLGDVPERAISPNTSIDSRQGSTYGFPPQKPKSFSAVSSPNRGKPQPFSPPKSAPSNPYAPNSGTVSGSSTRKSVYNPYAPKPSDGSPKTSGSTYNPYAPDEQSSHKTSFSYSSTDASSIDRIGSPANLPNSSSANLSVPPSGSATPDLIHTSIHKVASPTPPPKLNNSYEPSSEKSSAPTSRAPSTNPYAPSSITGSTSVTPSIPSKTESSYNNYGPYAPVSDDDQQPLSSASASVPGASPSLAPIQDSESEQPPPPPRSNLTSPKPLNEPKPRKYSTGFNPYAPNPAATKKRTIIKSPGLHAQALAKTSKPGTPSAETDTKRQYMPANESGGNVSRAKSPSIPASQYGGYGGYTPFDFNTDSKNDEDKKNEEIKEEDSKEEADGEEESESKSNFYAPYVPPQYGHKAEDDEENLGADSESGSQDPSNFFVPLGAPSFTPASTYAPAMPLAHASSTDLSKPASSSYSNYTNHNDDDDDEMEDLGFSNKPLKPKKTEDENEKKEKEQEKEKENHDNKEKKGWFGWLSKKNDNEPKAIKAKLGQENSFYFDPELKRWVNKNASPEEQAKSTLPPPPPPGPSSHSKPGSASMTPSGSSSSLPPMGTSSAMPPRMGPTSSSASATPKPTLGKSGDIDDLLAVAPTTVTRKKKNARSRYVDIMNQK